MRCGIIGGTGWLGSALGKRLIERGVVAPGNLAIANRSGPRPAYHGHQVRWCKDAAALAQMSDVIILSIRPEDWPGLAFDAQGKLVISFMAGIGAASLARCGGRILRAMPNAAAPLGQSYSPFWAAPGVDAADRAMARQILGAIGTSDELPQEAQIDLMTALPGSGAAYPALMVLAMQDFLTRKGLPEALAWRAAEATLTGGHALFAGDVAKARALLQAYANYGGTTAAGLAEAEAAGFSKALIRALEAATQKARSMAAPE